MNAYSLADVILVQSFKDLTYMTSEKRPTFNFLSKHFTKKSNVMVEEVTLAHTYTHCRSQCLFRHAPVRVKLTRKGAASLGKEVSKK